MVRTMAALSLVLAVVPAMAVSLSMVPGLLPPLIEGGVLNAMETQSRVVSSSSNGAPPSNGMGLDISKIADVLAKEPAAAKGAASGGMDGLDLDCDDPPQEGGAGAMGGAAAPGGARPAAGAGGAEMAEMSAAPAPAMGAEAEMAGGAEGAAPAPGGHLASLGITDHVPSLDELLAQVRGEKGGDAAPMDPARTMRLARQVQVLEDLIGHAKEINKLIPTKEKKLKQLKTELDSATAGARKETAERKLIKQEALLKVVDEKLAALKERVGELEEVHKKLKEDIAKTKEEAGAGGSGSGAGDEAGSGAAAFIQHMSAHELHRHHHAHAVEMTSEGDSDW